MKLLSEHPLLIGQILARSDRRLARRAFWRRLFGRDREARVNIVRFSHKEIVISHGR
jgi:hypothetical protein